jgi:FkbM family methyltransferase
MTASLLKTIKSNALVRRVVQRALGSRISSRAYKSNPAAHIHFPASKHMNLFFSRYASMEPVITDNIRSFVNKDSIVFDIGANIGYYTLLFSAWANAGKVVAVEPDPDNIAVLENNIERNQCKNVDLVKKAISSTDGSASFFQDRNTGRTSSLVAGAFQPPGMYSSKTISVSTTSIDALCKEYGMPSVIKCDVETAEVEVLKGASCALRGQPVIMIEVGPNTAAAVRNILLAHDYVLFDAERPFSANAPWSGPEFPANFLAVAQKRLIKGAL